MKAMIFAAGLGTRLQPITNNIPKALVELKGTPLLEIVIKKLISFGFDEIIVNVHHFADLVTDFLKTKNNFGIKIEISYEQDLLLDTGGGLKKASWFFNDSKPFLVYNVDVLSDIDLQDFYNFHIQSKSLATLAVRNRETSRYLLFNKENILCGWKNIKTGEIILARSNEKNLTPIAFSGIQIIDPKIFKFINQDGKFSIINSYLELAKKHKISAYNHDDTIWMDLGKIENLIEAEKLIDKIL
ncbi:MAG: nucleotidyltransferase family protein [Saprospiraceae bacterium]|nr:nucleotidyltransferase family protein [Saprospiraceae bacterium]